MAANVAENSPITIQREDVPKLVEQISWRCDTLYGMVRLAAIEQAIIAAGIAAPKADLIEERCGLCPDVSLVEKPYGEHLGGPHVIDGLSDEFVEWWQANNAEIARTANRATYLIQYALAGWNAARRTPPALDLNDVAKEIEKANAEAISANDFHEQALAILRRQFL